MILYLDASALVKRYIAEAGSAEVNQLIAQSDIVGTGIVSRAEVVAAFAKAVRVRLLPRVDVLTALQAFRSEWQDLRLQITEAIVAQADALAWKYGLRGYDAIHLASAVFWQEAMGEPVTLASFDRVLWQAAQKAAISAWPQDLE